MRKFLKIAAGAAALSASLLTAAAPAEARPYGYRYHGGYYHHGGGGALVAGIAGLAVGAAIADSARPHYGYGYYGPPRPYGYGYGYGPGYGYYGAPVAYYAPRCWTQFRFDPYYGRVPVRVCG